MSLDEFFNAIDNYKDYVVKVAYKYHSESEYTIRNQLLVCEADGAPVWLYDWDEGQSSPEYGDVKVLGYIEVEDVYVPKLNGAVL